MTKRRPVILRHRIEGLEHECLAEGSQQPFRVVFAIDADMAEIAFGTNPNPKRHYWMPFLRKEPASSRLEVSPLRRSFLLRRLMAGAWSSLRSASCVRRRC